MEKLISWIGGFIQALLLFLLPVASQILQPDDHYLLRYYAAVNRVVQPVLHKVFLLLFPGSGKPIREILFQRNGYSQTQYKKAFNAYERNKLDNAEPSSGYDITLLYKLLQMVCGLADTNSVTWSESGSFENCLKRLKDHRNALAHENLSLSFNEVQEKLKDLEELCRNVLIIAGLRRRKLIMSDIAEMERGIEDALLGGIDLWKPYREALNNLRLEQSSILLKEGRDDIQRMSKRLKILNPFAWLLDSNYSHLDVEHVFTKLSIEGSSTIEMVQLLTTKLPSGDLPDVIVLSGPAGYGKSSFFRFLVHDWLSSNPTVLGMENIDLVLPVEFRHVHNHDLRALIHDEILQNVSKHLKIDDIMASLKSISVLWLLDGYDEGAVEARKIIREIINKFPNSRMFITTRTEFTHEVEISLSDVNQNYMKVELKGFSSSSVEECAKKLISVYVTDVQVRKVKLEMFTEFTRKGNHLSWDIFTVPLYISIIVVLWLESPEKLLHVETKSGLYDLLVTHIVHKLMVRDSYKRLNQQKFVLEKKINKFLDFLGTLLWDKGEYSLQQYEVEYLEERCSEHELPFTDTMSSFFVYAERSTATEVKEEFTIIHRTMMEFLVGRAFARKMIFEGWDVITTAEEFFKNKRKTLLKHEPKHHSLFKYDVVNMSKDLPTDIYCTKSLELNFSMPSRAFFVCDNICEVHGIHEMRIENYKNSRDGNESIRRNNLWCHMRDHMGGMWCLFLLGYLNIKHELKESICEQFIFMFYKYDSTFHWRLEDFLIFIGEGNNHLFASKLCGFVANTHWAFLEDIGINAAKDALKIVSPKSVYLHYCYGTKDLSKILSDSIIVFVNYSLDIHLDLRYFLCNSDPELRLTKNCLEKLLGETACCRLVTLTCPVDDEIVSCLRNATYLHKLTIRFQGENFIQLAELIGSLPELKTLTLALNLDSYDKAGCPVLIQESVILCKLTIVVNNVFKLDPQFVGLALRNFCCFTSSVVIHGSLSEVDFRNIFTYIYWISTYLNQLKKLEIILDLPNFFSEYRELKLIRFKVFIGKIFPNVNVSFLLQTGKHVFRKKKHTWYGI